MDSKIFEKDRKMAEKYLSKSSIFRNVTGCNSFSKVSLHKKVNSSRKFLQTYSEICIYIFRNMYFLCDAIELKQSMVGTLKV